MEPSRVDIIQSNKGHFKIIHNGFMYTKHKSFSNVTRWRCAARGSCRGSIMTNNDFSRPVPKMAHSHPSDHKACELAKSRYLIPKVQSFVFKKELFKRDDLSEDDPLDVGTYATEVANLENIAAPKPHFMDVLGLKVQPGGPQPQVQSPATSPLPVLQKQPSPPPQLVKKVYPPAPPLHRASTGTKDIKIAPKPPSKPQPPPEVCLRWNSYHSNMQNTFPSLLNNEQFVDVTLACDGRSIKCHKVMLSACSPYMEELLSANPCQHPIIFLKDMKFWQLAALVDFMYRGEVNVTQDKLPSLLSAAEALQIKGLASPVLPSTPPQHLHDSDASDTVSYLRQFQPEIKTEEDDYNQDTDDSLPSEAPKPKKRKFNDNSVTSGSYQVNGKKPRDKEKSAHSKPHQNYPNPSTPIQQGPPPAPPLHGPGVTTTVESHDDSYQTQNFQQQRTPASGDHNDDLDIDEEQAQMILERYTQQGRDENYSRDGDDYSNGSG